MSRPLFLSRWLPILIPGLIGAALLWALLPPMVVAMDDDFWYLRSVIKTLWHGRPWTDEWLTPWSAVTSSLSAILYRVTGSFRFAINGSLVLVAGLAWAGFAWLHRARGLRTGEILALGALVFLFPTQLFMEMMFTSVALYWAALWWCLALAIRGRWIGFFIVWALAVANRQSAVAWMAIPAWSCLVALWGTRFRRPYSRETLILAAVVAAGGLWVIFLIAAMNPTMGRELALGHAEGLEHWQRAAVSLGLAGCAIGAGLGLGRLVTMMKSGGSPDLSRQRLVLGVIGALAGAAAALWFRTGVTNTHNCFSVPGAEAVFALFGLLAGGALGYSPPRIAPGFGWAALGSSLLVVYYGGVFDYHHSDSAFLAYAAVLGGFRPSELSEKPARRHRVLLAAVASWVCFTVVWDAACALRLKVAFETGGASAKLYEKALREGSLTPDQIGFGPFGYLGWRLHDYHIERGEFRSIAGFMHYTDAWDGSRGTSVLTRFSPLVKKWPDWFPTHNSVPLREHPDGKDIASIKSVVLWNQPTTFTLRRVEGAGRGATQPVVDPALYRAAPFPLSDAEWRKVIESGSIAQ